MCNLRLNHLLSVFELFELRSHNTWRPRTKLLTWRILQCTGAGVLWRANAFMNSFVRHLGFLKRKELGQVKGSGEGGGRGRAGPTSFLRFCQTTTPFAAFYTVPSLPLISYSKVAPRHYAKKILSTRSTQNTPALQASAYFFYIRRSVLNCRENRNQLQLLEGDLHIKLTLRMVKFLKGIPKRPKNVFLSANFSGLIC